MNKKIALFALLGIASFAPMASAQYIYLIGKDQDFLQTNVGASAPDSAHAYRFEASINGGTQDANTPASSNNITTPGGGLGLVNIAFDASSGQWDYKQDFTTQSAMEAAFPNGTYTFNSGGTTANFPLTGNLYTNIPTATFNLGGIWSNSIYYIQPGQDLMINTNSIAGFTTGNFRVGIDANVNNNINSYASIQFDSLNNGLTTANGNITIPSSELTAGTDWQVKMQFNAFSNFTSSGINGGTNVALYTMNTKFDVQVVPEPSETALMIGTLALGAAQLWRRRKA